MRWRKQALVLSIEHRSEWMWSHAAIPTGLLVDENVLRIYFGTRDREGLSRVTFADVRADDPSDVLYTHDRPLFDLGARGAFDDTGVMPSCVVEDGDRTLLFYIGWTTGGTVPYRLSIGVAASDDGGTTFSRVFHGPVVDRTSTEPYFVTVPYVLKEGSLWRMWYVSSTGWLEVNGRPEPVYEVKYAESGDGLTWARPNVTCIAPSHREEAIGRPCVVADGGTYRMWYCYRGSVDYRTDKRQAYRIGYAESVDGVGWERKDDEAGIDRSESGWDSVMIEYPFVYEHRGTKFMLYNGDGFGKTGIGYAVLEDT
jgi:predicted GH43/DUF377 family glycosyl hydrolase